MLLFTVAIALIDGVLFGVLPAWRTSQADPQEALRSDSPRTRYPTPLKRSNFFRSVLERACSLPGVTSVGLSNLLPLSGGTGPGNTFVVDEFPVPPSERPSARIRVTNGDFFRAMGIPLKQGRTFRDDDNGRVAIVSSLTAMRAWSSEQVVGKQLRLGSETGPAVDIVGVVGDVRATSLTADPTLEIYLPFGRLPSLGRFRCPSR